MTGEGSDFGKFLRAEREARGITLDEVSQRTRVKRQWLEYIDEGRLADLPATVFVRGFVRAYADAIGCDAKHVLSLLDARLNEFPDARSPAMMKRKRARGLERNAVPIVSGLVLLVLAALIVLRLAFR